MLLYVILVSAMILCALCAIRARQLLTSVIWLAGLSALASILLYAMGAPEIAVIELSVGAGLVTVLFVFAIGIAGEITRDLASIVPRWLAWTMSIAAVVLLGWLVWPGALDNATSAGATIVEAAYSATLWEARAVDMGVAILLVFVGVLGMLNLLPPTHQGPQASSGSAKQNDSTDDTAWVQADSQHNSHGSEQKTGLQEAHP
jgi:uncharacterized MnhB-related membrane protein